MAGALPLSAAIPEVSIVIPTRDRWRLLSTHALPSALAQEDVNFEVIVVDDGSIDETPARLAELDNHHLRVLRHQVPKGAAAARNTGIAAARGEWLAFLDDDDLWSPRKLRGQIGAALADDAGWVYAAAVVVDERGAPMEVFALPKPDTLPERLMSSNVIPGGDSNVVARADIVRCVGGFDETLLCFEDWDLWIRLAQATRAAVCDDVLVATLEHPASVTYPTRTRLLAQLERVLGKHRRVTRGDRLSAVEWLAGEHNRAGHRLRAAGLHLRAAYDYRSLGNLAPALGALFGDRGMKLASSLLVTTRGRSHVQLRGNPAPVEPAWLQLYREEER